MRLIDPAGVRRYLAQKLGDALTDVRAAMETLAKAYPPDQLAAHAFALYEDLFFFRFRDPLSST